MTMYALVIENEAQVREFVSHVLAGEGWDVTQADSAESAFEMLHDKDWSVAFCDVVLGGLDGFSVLSRFKEELPQTKVVLMTGYGSASGALDAAAFGAYDYLLKPFGADELRSLSKGIREQLLRQTSVRRVSRDGKTSLYDSDIELIGRSEVFIEVMKQVGRVAGKNLPVLLTGESGTGKEVVASALHHRSARSAKPFVAVNCGAIPADLIESELFGHVRGAFTGADRDRLGIWEEADGGTIFLDEITETSTSFQVKLLRALQEGEIRPVGSNQTRKIDVRVIAASNRDVADEVQAGRFRQDLYYRLNAVSIVLPPLRDRKEDILLLAKSFASRVYSLNSPVKFSTEALAVLENYSWPGNIRELENAVVRATALCDGIIRPQDLPEQIRASGADPDLTPSTAADELEAIEWQTLADVEGTYVKRVLAHTRGNKQAASRILNIDRKTLDRIIKRHKKEAITYDSPSQAA